MLQVRIMNSSTMQTKRIKRTVGKLVKNVFLLLGLPVCGIFVFYLYVSWNLPPMGTLKTTEGLRSLHRFDRQSAQQVVLLPLNEIPPHVVNAFIAANDANFAERNFFDGGSFARGLAQYLLFANKKKISHLELAVLQFNIGLFLDREEILGAWLAMVYFGKNTFGVSAAARKYYDKPLQGLTLCEAAVLASIPQASIYNPIDHPDQAKKRQEFVLGRMVALGLANKADLEGCK